MAQKCLFTLDKETCLLDQTTMGFCSLRTSTRSESLCNVNRDSSVKSREAHCCLVQETCSLAQWKRALLFHPFKGAHTNDRLAYIPALWRCLRTVVAEILLPEATKWSATYWSTAAVLLHRAESAKYRSLVNHSYEMLHFTTSNVPTSTCLHISKRKEMLLYIFSTLGFWQF